MKNVGIVFTLSFVFLALAVINHAPSANQFDDFQFEKQSPERSPQSLRSRFSTWWTSIRRPLKGAIECVENCTFERFPKRLVANVSEGEEIVFKFKPKKDLPLSSRFVKYSEGWNVSFIPDTGGWTQVRISPKVGFGRRNHSAQTNYMKDTLWLSARDPSLSAEGIRLKRVRLRIHYGPYNRIPTWEIPESVAIRGARGKGSITVIANDLDEDTMLLFCGDRRKYFHQNRATFTINENTTCVLKEHGVVVLTQEIRVDRTNTAPVYSGPESIELGFNDNQFTLQGNDAEGDRIEFECTSGNINICDQSGAVDVSRLSRPGRYQIKISLNDGAETITKKIDVTLTNNRSYEKNYTVPEGFPLQLLVMDYQGEVTRETPEGFWQDKIINVPENFSGDISAVFDNGELEKTRVLIRINRRAQSEFTNIERTLNGPENKIELNDSTNEIQSMKLLSFSGAEYSLPNGMSIDQINNKVVFVVDWTKVETQTTIGFWLVITKSNSILWKKFQFSINPPLGDGVLANLSLSPGEAYETELKLDEAIKAQIRSINLNGLETALGVFPDYTDEAHRPGNYDIRSRDVGKKIFFVAKNKPGNHELPVLITLRDGTNLAGKVLVHIERAEKESLRVKIHVATKYNNRASVSNFQIFKQWKKSRKIFEGNTNLILEDFVSHHFQNGSAGMDTQNDDDVADVNQIIDNTPDVLNVFYFQTVTYDTGNQIGGLAPYPTRSNQRHYIYVSEASDDSTLAHELGHNFGIHHTFESKFNAYVTLCTKTVDYYGEEVCRSRGISGNLVLPNPHTNEPLTRTPFIGDKIDDTIIDAHGLRHYSDNCYGFNFGYDNDTDLFACVAEGGITLGHSTSTFGSSPCRFSSVFDHSAGRRRNGLSCQYGFSEESSVFTNVMSYWPDQIDSSFSSDQKEHMRNTQRANRYYLKNFMTD